MKLNRESEYGLKALVFLAQQRPGAVFQASTIAEAKELPRGFLAKIFQKLTQHGLLRSHRGKRRGYTLARAPEEIFLREIVEAIEGPGLFDRCIFWSGRCSTTNPCLLHEWFKEVKPRLEEMLTTTTLAEVLAQNALAGGTELCREFAPGLFGAEKRQEPPSRP